MAEQVGAQTHEESKFWRASNPLPNKSSVQGRESKEESNTDEFHKTKENFTATFHHF